MRSELKPATVKLAFPAALLLYIITAWFSSGFYHPDEHYQIIEFANYKMGRAQLSDLAWEFEAGIRPGFQPALCYVLLKAGMFFGITDPYHLAFLLRLITAILAVFVIRAFIRVTKDSVAVKYQPAYEWISYFLWFLPFLNVRFSSENWSGLFFIIGLTIILGNRFKGNLQYLLLGLAFGLCVLFRYQSAFLVLGALAWMLFVAKTPVMKLIPVAFAGLLMAGAGMLADRWLYGEHTFTLFNYFHTNIVQDVASRFGVSPWYEIFVYILIRPGAIGIFMLAAMVILMVKQPRHFILWTSIPFIFVHTIIPHKELRFFFPLVNMIPLMLVLAYQETDTFYKRPRLKSVSMFFAVVLLVVNIASLIVVTTKGAGTSKVAGTDFIYHRYKEQKVNLMAQDVWNPYLEYGCPYYTFYRTPNVTFTPITSVWQPDISNFKKPGYTNVVVVPWEDFRKGDVKVLAENLRMVRVGQNIPWFDVQLMALIMPSSRKENLVFFEFKD